ncbi:DUF6146 family protein [Flavobacterium cellulosilyticum]|uniref:Lipoprotein n=1 Tax=Flavobacterium cellulosilyticum TaxID=2541731 RepID=A0A4R5CBV5_9FLAO|nr:DUF6146 family protein [Flavobacterium cellulosilyticum]TDD97441.1 hypothetical protein E0F76_09040 [Flavobacterium cellulosilyticum]
MKITVYILLIFGCLVMGCNAKKPLITDKKENIKTIQSDTIRIANDSLQYEVIIIDPGFSTWLASRAYSRGYLSQSYMENKNRLYIMEWNNRVLQPQLYNPNLYEMTINYDPNIDYGYEVNYLIYNYMIYFQNTFKQTLYGYVPTR